MIGNWNMTNCRTLFQGATLLTIYFLFKFWYNYTNLIQEKYMTQKEKIAKLIEIVELLTKRCKKIEVDSLNKNLKLQKRIEELEEKTINIVA